MIEDKKFEEALIDVRKAYRLLHAYQSRVLDLIKYVSAQLHMSLLSAWPWYTDTTVKGDRVDLDNWAFDWLPMYLYEFVLLSMSIENRDCKFAIIIVPDTGCYDSDLQWKDRNRVNLFKKVEASSSKIVFMVGENKWHGGGESMLNMFKADATEHVEKDDTGVFFVKSYKLSYLFDSPSIDEVINDLVKSATENGISFLHRFAPLHTTGVAQQQVV